MNYSIFRGNTRYTQMVQEMRPTAPFILAGFLRIFMKACSEKNYEHKWPLFFSYISFFPVEDLPNQPVTSTSGTISFGVVHMTSDNCLLFWLHCCILYSISLVQSISCMCNTPHEDHFLMLNTCVNKLIQNITRL